MVSDIYFPIPPSPYPAFYPISPPINYSRSQTPQRTIRSPQNISSNYTITSTKRHDQVYDANRNHVVPYYYSETLTPCMPNNLYSVPNTHNRNRHTFASYPYDERQKYYQRIRTNARINNAVNPETSHSLKSNSIQPQPFRPYSVLERSTNSPISKIQRPSSVMPDTEQFRPASAFFQNEPKSEIPEWKARLIKETPKLVKGLDQPLKPICKIPDCNCNGKPIVDRTRFSESRTLPSVSPRSLLKQKNLSLPTLKLEEFDKDEKFDTTEAERDVPSVLNKPISEQHLGYV